MATISWPFPARTQQGDRLRRIGVLMNLAAEDPVSIARAKAFAQGLQALGWIEGRNVSVDYRWAAGKADLFNRHAAEIAALAPDVILAAGTGLPPILQATRTIPVVFVHVADPVGNNYVAAGRQHHWLFELRVQSCSEVG
jgi:putative ABC transport system substrate-binding protein